MTHSPQLFSSKKGGNVLHTSNIIECDLNEVKNSISKRRMVNNSDWRQPWLIDKRSRLRLALSSGGLIQYTTISLVKQGFLSKMNRYQNVFMFCSCTAFSGMSAKTHSVLLNCASFTANNRRNKGCKQGFFSAIFTKFIKMCVEKVRKSRRFEDDRSSQWLKAFHAQYFPIF